MTDVYDHEETNGPAAPFFEYAIISSWLDKDYLRLNRFWMDGSLPVAFIFYEQPVTSTYFVLRPGYEFLAAEMIEYAETAYPKFEETRELIFSSGQTALIEEAKSAVTVWSTKRLTEYLIFGRENWITNCREVIILWMRRILIL